MHGTSFASFAASLTNTATPGHDAVAEPKLASSPVANRFGPRARRG
jgi:hypothetical protein